MSYRALRLVVGAGLLGMSYLGVAQTLPSPEDSLKGRIWTATARRIWADTRPPQPLPTAWPTVQAFDAWRAATPADKSELGLLWGAVVASTKGVQATPAQVAKAILTQITQRQQTKKGRLARLKLADLQADFAQFASPKAGAAPAPGTNSTTVEAIPGASGLTALPGDTTRPPAPLGQPAAPTFISTPAEPRYFGLSPTLAGLALVLLGGLAGLLLAQATRRPRHRHHAHPASLPTEPDSSSVMNAVEYRKLQNQNKQLRNELQKIKQQLAALQKQLSAAADTAAPLPAPAEAPVAAAPALPEAADDSLFAVALPPPAAPSQPIAPSQPVATRYGPVQETPFVEERKIVDTPLPQLALMLTVAPHSPDVATFTLNPNVDQARLIGDGLTRLQKFFDYDPPLGGRITLVTAAAPGQLQRHADGWQVVQRARLTIS